MSTPDAEASPKKRYTTAEIEAMLSSAPHAASLTCQQLCDELQNDADTLQNLQDFPTNQRGRIAAALRRDMIAISTHMRQQHCPACD